MILIILVYDMTKTERFYNNFTVLKKSDMELVIT